MTIIYIDPNLAIDDTTAVGWPFSNGSAYTPTGVQGSKGPGVIYDSPANAYSSVAGSGHQYGLRRGRFFDRVGAALFNAYWTKSFCTTFTWGDPTAAKPVLDGHIYHTPTPANDALWTYAGAGTWYIELAGATNACRAFRTGVGFDPDSKTSRRVGKFWIPAANVNDVVGHKGGVTGIWFGATGAPYRITVYTGTAAIAPPTFYGGISISQQGSGVANGLIVRNGASYNQFRDFQIWGAAFEGCGADSFTAGGAVGNTFEGVDIIACYKNQVIFGSNQAAGFIARSNSWSGLIDMQQDNIESKDNPTTNFLNDDLIKMVDGTEGTYIHDFEVRCNTVHTVINMTPESGGILYRPKNNTIMRGKITMSQYAIDGRALGIGAVQGLNIIDVYITGTCTKSQVSGQNINIVACYFGPLAYNAQANNQRSTLEITNLNGDPAVLDVNILNNVFNTSGNSVAKAAISINTYVTAVAGVAANVVCIANNIAIGDLTDAFFAKLPYNAAADAAKPISNQQILNNYFVRADGATAIASTGNATGDIQNDAFSLTQPLNGFMGSSGNLGGTAAVAKVSTDGFPASDSPVIGAGATDISRVDAAGNTYIKSFFVGAFGKIFGKTPNIGRY